MAEKTTIKASARDKSGTSNCRRMRRDGRIPGVLYGRKQGTVTLDIDRDEFLTALRHDARVIELAFDDGKTESTMIQEIQWDHLGERVYHIDFSRISLDEEIEATVAIELLGVPKGVIQGGKMQHPVRTVTIKCLPIALPDKIELPVSKLDIGDAIRVNDLPLGAGVRLSEGQDEEDVIVQILSPKGDEEEEAEGEAGEGPAEPEVIGTDKEDEGGES